LYPEDVTLPAETNMSEKNESADEILSRQQLELNRLKDALSLLGINDCGWCKKFFRRTDAGALFDAGGELICYGDIPQWWPQRRTQLAGKERENLEGKLVRNFQRPGQAPRPVPSGTQHSRDLPGMSRNWKITRPGPLPLLRRPRHSLDCGL
jgi:hypothetical protein